MLLQVNGVELYYEKSGTGLPIILLHGNGETHAIFDTLTAQLSPAYTVYAIDSRSHGQSSAVNELHYADMMQDIAAFIQQLQIQKPILYGFSDGGIIGLLLAIEYPDMLSKLLVSGANSQPNGVKGIFLLAMKIAYFFSKDQKLRMMLTEPNIESASLSQIKTPTYIMAGSKDIIRAAHTKALAESIPYSVLEILSGEGHASYVVNSAKLYMHIKSFLFE